MRERINNEAPDGTMFIEPGALSDSRVSGPHRAIIGGIILGFGILFGGTVGYLLAHAQRSKSSDETRTDNVGPPIEIQSSVERQMAARRLAVFTEAALPPFAPPGVAMAGFVATSNFSPPYEAIDAALFDTGASRIHLARIQPVGRHEVCTDSESRRFACGLMGRATLQNLLARHEITCVPLFLAKQKQLDFFEADCRVDGTDIAEHLVRAGFAFPSPLAGERLTNALTDAQTAGAGVWSGPHTVPNRDPVFEDAKETEIGSTRLAPSQEPPQNAPSAGGQDGRTMAGASPTPAEPLPKHRTAPPRKAHSLDVVPVRRPPPPTTSRRDDGGRSPSAARPVSDSGVIAGPILPPPEALAKKLGTSTSTGSFEPSEYVRGSSDR